MNRQPLLTAAGITAAAAAVIAALPEFGVPLTDGPPRSSCRGDAARGERSQDRRPRSLTGLPSA